MFVVFSFNAYSAFDSCETHLFRLIPICYDYCLIKVVLLCLVCVVSSIFCFILIKTLFQWFA